MDWNSLLTLINGADTLLGVAILIVAARYGFRALRRSEPRAEPFLDSHRGPLGNTGTDNPCPLCNPQPTSPPQSEPWPGPPVGLSELSDANHPSTHERPASEENED